MGISEWKKLWAIFSATLLRNNGYWSNTCQIIVQEYWISLHLCKHKTQQWLMFDQRQPLTAKCRVLSTRHPFHVPIDISSFPYECQIVSIWISQFHSSHWRDLKVLLDTLWKYQIKSSPFKTWESNCRSFKFIFNRSLLWQTEMNRLPPLFFNATCVKGIIS